MKSFKVTSNDLLLDRPSKPSDRHACLNDPRFKTLLDEFDLLLDEFLTELNFEIEEGHVLDFVLQYLTIKRNKIHGTAVEIFSDRKTHS